MDDPVASSHDSEWDMDVDPPEEHHSSQVVRVAPIETVPNELLIYIFQLGRGLTRQTKSEVSFPIVVSHVSSRWRRVATHTPALWTNIFVHSLKSLACASTYTQRSARYELDITCDWSGRELIDMWPLWVIAESIDKLAFHSYRWREFVFKTDNSLHVDIVVSRLGRIAAPRLQSLRLLFFNQRQVVPRNHTPFSPYLPTLTTLDLYFPEHGWMPTYANFRDIIAASPLLTTLTLRSICPNWPRDDQVDVIEIPSLRSLSLGGFSGNQFSIARILATLATPALENFELLSQNSDCWHIFRLVHERKGRVFPSVRSLTLMNVELPKGTVVWLASTFPCITHLVVLHTHLDNVAEILAERIAYPSNPSGLPVWPELRSCTFMPTQLRLRPRMKQLLLDILSNRKSAGMPLAELRCARSLDEHTGIRECLHDGVRFAVFSETDYSAYLNRDIHHPNAEENITGTHRFWCNSLDVTGG
jgi:hypothetical protein